METTYIIYIYTKKVVWLSDYQMIKGMCIIAVWVRVVLLCVQSGIASGCLKISIKWEREKTT
jgi:hypothetical protein